LPWHDRAVERVRACIWCYCRACPCICRAIKFITASVRVISSYPKYFDKYVVNSGDNLSLFGGHFIRFLFLFLRLWPLSGLRTVLKWMYSRGQTKSTNKYQTFLKAPESSRNRRSFTRAFQPHQFHQILSSRSLKKF
jgi:hypothetical protein